MELKERIEEELKKLNEELCYGVGRFKERETWDCIVYGRRRTRKNETGKSLSKIWFVAIVKEEEIPEDMEKKVVDGMRAAGLKRTEGAAEYSYTTKSGECLVEMCVMEFYKTVKECG